MNATVTRPETRRLNPSEVIAVVKRLSRYTTTGVLIDDISRDTAAAHNRPALTANEDMELSRILTIACAYGFLARVPDGYRPA